MISPQEAQYITESQIAIKWDDGTEGFYTAQQIRQACRCAQCVSEMTGEQILKPESVSEELTFLDWQQVGNYAYNFKFSDNHSSGIYSFDHLKKIKP